MDQQCANPLAAPLLLHCTELYTCVRVRPLLNMLPQTLLAPRTGQKQKNIGPADILSVNSLLAPRTFWASIHYWPRGRVGHSAKIEGIWISRFFGEAEKCTFSCIITVFLFLFVPIINCVVFEFLCARLCIYVWCNFGRCPARRVNSMDATPIVQSRPAPEGNNQTHTDKRTTITHQRNQVDFSFPFVSWPQTHSLGRTHVS